MTPLAEARLYGRAIRRFNPPPGAIDEALQVLLQFVKDDAQKPSVRVSAANSLIAAEALNQKDEHKLLSLMASNDTVEHPGNRFLESAIRLGIKSNPGNPSAS